MAIPDKIYGSVVEGLPSLSGKCYAITGTTSGTGLWAAIAAVRKGASCVLLLNRASARADAAEQTVKAEIGNTRIVAVDCDLQSLASVRKAAEQVHCIAAEFGGLDGLINNAGIMAVPDTRTADGYDVQMHTNHLSHFLLTKLLMSSLEAAANARGEARIVQHSSGARRGEANLEAQYFATSAAGTLGGNKTAACFGRYHQTKLANSVFAQALHQRLTAAGSKVRSICAEPGVSATSLMVNMSAQHKASRPQPKPKGDGAKPKQSSPPPGMNFKPQSAADGACPLMEASFGSSANSGDFYMPGEMVEMTPVGIPVKCMTAGKATPATDMMAAMFSNEEMTCSLANQALLWTESEKATEVFNLGKLSKL